MVGSKFGYILQILLASFSLKLYLTGSSIPSNSHNVDCELQQFGIICLYREARRRGTSIFLPTVTYPMFPDKLAMEKMSLQQGELCNAVSVSVTLEPDGRY